MIQLNHQVARDFFEALSTGDVPDSLLTPDMAAWTTSTGAWSDKARFQSGIKQRAQDDWEVTRCDPDVRRDRKVPFTHSLRASARDRRSISMH